MAVAVTDVFLRINGWRLQRNPLQLHEELMRLLESGQFQLSHIEPWLRTFVVREDTAL